MPRLENAGARTWLLGAVALWAVCVWVLALFGLGGRVARLPEDPALAGRLPQPVAPVPERLGALAQYASIGDRPLFTDDRRPQPFFIDPAGEEGAAAPTFNYVLTSVIDTPRFQMAILQNSDGTGEPVRLKIGDAPTAAPGWTLRSLDTRSVVFDGPEGERKLELRVFDGNGGQPPTAVAAPNGQPNAMPVPPPMPPPSGTAQVAPPPADQPPPPPPTPPADAAGDAAKTAEETQAAQDQIDSIRKRIEARRARLRQEASQRPPTTPAGQNP